jgi:hypothetical protein
MNSGNPDPTLGTSLPSDREIGRYGGTRKGPSLIFFGGIHGNEPAGPRAIREVLDILQHERPDFRGLLVGLHGNRAALQAGKRFIVRDLNRIWYPGSFVDPARRLETPEYLEKVDILHKLLDLTSGKDPVYLFDLHSTSAQSVPFISISDTLKNRQLIRNLPVTLVLGLEELLDGPMFSFFSEMGLPAILFEAGQNDSYATVENHRAFIWLMLQRLGCLRKEFIAQLPPQEEVLRKNHLKGPAIFEIKYRHLLNGADDFRMRSGYVNFQPVRKGEVLARDRSGDIPAPRSGRIFMPLYQPLGLEGFFIVRRIRPFWFRFSQKSRQWKMDRALRLLPGIRGASRRPDTFLVNRHVARWRVTSLFHLFGYRKVVDEGRYITFSRRPYDDRLPNMRQVHQNIRDYLESLMALK